MAVTRQLYMHLLAMGVTRQLYMHLLAMDVTRLPRVSHAQPIRASREAPW